MSCLICRKPMPGYEPIRCCSGIDCNCGGEPLNPCVCGFKCLDALIAGIGKPYEQRRIDAGIDLWREPGEAPAAPDLNRR